MIAIDLGSSSLRAIAFDCTSMQMIDAFEAVVKTAENIEKSNVISLGARDRIVEALLKADAKLGFASHTIIAVTTEAMRRANNATEVLEYIYKQTSVHFRIISANEEAYLSALGVSHRLKILGIMPKNYVLFDLGGGSTEIIFSQDGKIDSKSFNIGIVTTANNSTTPDEINRYLKRELLEVQLYVQRYYRDITKPEVLIATAGTPTTMAAFLQGMHYANYDSAKINGYLLHVKSIDTALEALLALNEKERTFYVGVGRETLIMAGIHIVKRLYAILGYEEAIVIDDGLREGLVIKGCKDV